MPELNDIIQPIKLTVMGVIRLSLAVSSLGALWLAQRLWTGEGWSWRNYRLHNDAKNDNEAMHAGEYARILSHLGWVVAGVGWLMIFGAGLFR